MAKSKLIKAGIWIGVVIALLAIVVGILFVTGTITFEITNVFFGWFVIIVGVYTLIESILLKALGII